MGARLWFVLAFAGCFSPRPQAGAPCPDNICPSGLVCSAATQTCELSDRDAGTRDDSASDSAIDTPVVPPDAQACFGAGIVEICPKVLPATALSVATPTTINTDTSTECIEYQDVAATFCVIAATDVAINSSLTGVGSRPLVVLATNAMTVSGNIEVASHRGSIARGAGAQPDGCVDGSPANNDKGGPGGSFAGVGGSGGNGESGGTRPLAAAATPNPGATFRGGCRGQDGSLGQLGNGGGAVYLIAQTSITISGTINASGASGGRSGANEEGGGGGGSGGMIGLDAPMVSVGNQGEVFANGGGGGAGNDASLDASDPTTAIVSAKGGVDENDDGDGGDGSANNQTDGGNGGNGGDGGGGGGGAGVIRVFPVQTLGGKVSPPPS